MSATEKGQVITANRLRDGLAVFMTHAGSWSDRIDDAVVALEPEAAAALEQAGDLEAQLAAEHEDDGRDVALAEGRIIIHDRGQLGALAGSGSRAQEQERHKKVFHRVNC